MNKREFDLTMHFIAQGVINIDEGHTTINAGSPIHKAMAALCTAVSAGDVVAQGLGVTRLEITDEHGHLDASCTLDEFLAESESAEICEQVAALDVGGSVSFGGGAAPFVTVTRKS